MNNLRFAPVDLCRKLSAAGCKSESGFYWEYDPLTDKYVITQESNIDGPLPEAFEQNDITGATERAKINAFRYWGDEMVCTFCHKKFKHNTQCSKSLTICMSYQNAFTAHRINMIHSDDWIEYLLKNPGYRETKNIGYTIEPIVHSSITDSLPDEHPLANKSIYCRACTQMLHAANNECMQDWLEFEDGNYCWECGTERLEGI